LRSSRSTWLSAALFTLCAGAALAQKIPPVELAALSHIQSAFFTGADAGVMAREVGVGPELQRSLGLSAPAEGAAAYRALVTLIGDRKFDSRRTTPAEIASYGARPGFQPVAQLPVTIEAADLRVLVQYDTKGAVITYVGQLGGDEPAAAEPVKPTPKAKPKPAR
jgi:hypothetical protein